MRFWPPFVVFSFLPFPNLPEYRGREEIDMRFVRVEQPHVSYLLHRRVTFRQFVDPTSKHCAITYGMRTRRTV